MKIRKKSVGSRKSNIKVKINKRVFLSFLFFISLVIFLISFMFELPSSAVLLGASLVCLVSYSLYEGIKKAKERNIFNFDFAVCASTVTLFCFGGFQQSVCCMFIYSVYRLVVDALSQKNVVSSGIYDLIKTKKYHCVEDRESVVVSSEDIKPGDFVELFSGEYVPVDGRVKAGSGTVSTVNITGDSKIETKYSGDYLMAGYTLLSGNIILEAETNIETSTLRRNCNDIENAVFQKTVAEKVLNIVTNIISIIVFIIIAVISVVKLVQTKDIKSIMYFVPAGMLFSNFEFVKYVISNSYQIGLYRFFKKGIIVNKKSFVENNLFTQNMGFTVNGVLTAHSAEIEEVYTELDITKDELLKFAAYAQYKNETDISKAILKQAGCRVKQSEISEYKKYAGNGSSIKLFNSVDVVTGTSGLLKSLDIVTGVEDDSTKLCVAINGNYVGYIEFKNEIKQDLRQCMDSLRFAGVKKITIVNESSVKTVSEIIKRASLGKADNSLKYDVFSEMYSDLKKRALLFCTEEYILDNEYISSIVYNRKENMGAQAYALVESLAAPVNFLNITKDIKSLMLQNTFICIVYKILFLAILSGGVSSLWLCFLLVLVSAFLMRMNEIRVLRKL